ncbi:hypothetical protein [Microcoleus sp. Pol12B4]|uniref:hypothetical protein n=1 Tax=Microcoleus sp. Pol12B4 TaxID=3055395 RepID=UPI002FD2BEFD
MFNLRIEIFPSTLTLHLLEQIYPTTYINPEDDRRRSNFSKISAFQVKVIAILIPLDRCNETYCSGTPWLGEQSDWAADDCPLNPATEKGWTLIARTNPGISVEVKQHPTER